MTDDQGRELRAALSRVAFQEPPESLRERARSAASQPNIRGRGLGATRVLLLGFAVLAVSLGGLLFLAGGPRSTMPPLATNVTPAPLPSPETVPPRTVAPTGVTVVDGLDVMTVSEAIAARDAGALPDDRAAIRGYWSNGSVGHSCVPRDYGELELYCHDGESGITELPEQIWVVGPGGLVTEGKGPHLTPFFPPTVEGLELIWNHPQYIHGQLYPPFPVLLVGHFNDVRAAACSKQARQLCRDRFVIDRIAQWEPQAVATPAITPTPTPFPSPWPSGLFQASDCIGAEPYSFLGWTTPQELGLPFERDGQLWAVVSRDPIDLADPMGADPDPTTNPVSTTHRLFARVICFRTEYETGAFEFAHVPGTEEIHWGDGLVTPGTELVRPTDRPG